MENENHSETRHVAHLMPCRIKYDGECSDAFTEKSFRGRRLFSTPAPESMKPLLITREGDDTEWKVMVSCYYLISNSYADRIGKCRRSILGETAVSFAASSFKMGG